jgi:hypothetical protein
MSLGSHNLSLNTTVGAVEIGIVVGMVLGDDESLDLGRKLGFE